MKILKLAKLLGIFLPLLGVTVACGDDDDDDDNDDNDECFRCTDNDGETYIYCFSEYMDEYTLSEFRNYIEYLQEEYGYDCDEL